MTLQNNQFNKKTPSFFKGPNFWFGLISGIVLMTILGIGLLLSRAVILPSKKEAGISQSQATTGTTSLQGSSIAQNLLKEIIPIGTPDYGEKAGVSYDEIQQSLNTLVGYNESITLDETQKQRYVKIGASPLTACEFCCGVGERGFAKSDGTLLCGCAHNIAFSGLTKWLIQNSFYTDEQIISEIGKWKILFFPKGSVEKEMQKRGITPSEGGLPEMRGGC